MYNSIWWGVAWNIYFFCSMLCSPPRHPNNPCILFVFNFHPQDSSTTTGRISATRMEKGQNTWWKTAVLKIRSFRTFLIVKCVLPVIVAHPTTYARWCNERERSPFNNNKWQSTVRIICSWKLLLSLVSLYVHPSTHRASFQRALFSVMKGDQFPFLSPAGLVKRCVIIHDTTPPFKQTFICSNLLASWILSAA